MPNGPGVPNRNVHFQTGAHEDYPSFDLPPEKESYYAGTEAGEALKEKMAGMSVKERNEHMRGLRETLNGSVPKKGDFDNPLIKDTPREQVARQPRPKNPMVQARQQRTKISGLARKARGRRR